MRARFPVLGLTVFVLAGLLGVGTARDAHAAWAITGIDVSQWQATIDWTQTAADPDVDFAIIKATQGQNAIDPSFYLNLAGARAEGLTVGMYHVATPSRSTDDARAEADHFLSVAQPLQGDIIPALDIEMSHVPDTMPPSVLEAWCRAWMNRVANRLGARPMIYGSESLFWNDLGNSTWFADHGFPWWIARWGPFIQPMPANNWQGQGWTFWQFINTAHVDGITTAVDRDRFAGTDLHTAEIASITAQPGAGGSIGDDTGRLMCGPNNTCTELYSPNDIVLLTAMPKPGYDFVGWGGACAAAGANDTCAVTALGARTATATFTYSLHVHVQGKVGGRVRSTPTAIDCPGTCSSPIGAGASVTLTSQKPDWTGVRWSGDCAGTAPACSFTMDAPHDVTATFFDIGPAGATIKPPPTPHDAVWVVFDEPVRHVTTDNLLVRPTGGAKLAAGLKCFNIAHKQTSCLKGAVRSARLDPLVTFRRGPTYVVLVDPVGVAPVRDRMGKATPLTHTTFRF